MNKCTLELTKYFRRKLKRLDKAIIEAVMKKLKELRENPFIGKPLKGRMKGAWRIRVRGKYRLLYVPKECLIHAIDIGHRKTIYDKY
ncbi:MAG: type II toxin-antitoxin system RelE/ParE family toxin [Thermoprotei archaeon]|nr:MAG: type II toxin-antitoxin system RelE/ParE family toxin [Thermoprotei archaeon]